MGTVLGFDSVDTKSDSELEQLAKDGYTIALFYLGGPEAEHAHKVSYAKTLHAHGFAILPTYVGWQEANVHGVPEATLQTRGKTTATDATGLLAVVRKHAPDALYLPLTLDWEGELTAEGATYVRAFLDAAAGPNLLYRTDAGVDTPERHVWVAKPGTGDATDSVPLIGTNQPYGHVDGVQYKWAHGIDYSVFIDTVIPDAHPVKTANVKKHKVDAEVKQAETEFKKVAGLSHPTHVMGRLAAVVAAGQALLISVQSGNPSTKGEVIAGVGTVGWALIQEVFTAVGVKPSTISAAYKAYKASKDG